MRYLVRQPVELFHGISVDGLLSRYVALSAGVMLAVRSEPNFRTSTPTGSAPTQQQQHDGRQQLQQRQRSPSPGTPVSPARSVLSYSSSPGHYVSHLAPPLPRTNLTSAIEHTELQSSGAATTASSANGLGEPQVSIGWPAVDRLETPVPARVQQHHHHPQRQHYDTSLMDDFSGGSLVAAALRNALSAGAGAGVGVLHLALQWSPAGLVCGWRQEITAVVEPGEMCCYPSAGFCCHDSVTISLSLSASWLQLQVAG